MHSYFISDLHLTPQRPQLTLAFFDFLSNQAVNAENLYILGDLFEYWIGNDAVEMLGAQAIIDAMLKSSEKTNCFFIAGNRDFLVTKQFSELSGFNILSDETVLDLYGTATLILHGDSLCTEDIEHQQFRQQIMTNTQFKQQFLSLPIKQRIEQAKQARIMSNKHKQYTDMSIMDVTEAAVIAAFEEHKVTAMIHGHTHRQNTHYYNINGKTASRTVLGDWQQTSSILKASPEGLEINNYPII